MIFYFKDDLRRSIITAFITAIQHYGEGSLSIWYTIILNKFNDTNDGYIRLTEEELYEADCVFQSYQAGGYRSYNRYPY